MLWKYIMYISIKAKNLTYFSNWLLFVVPFCINHTTSSMNQVPKGTATTNGMFHTCLPPGNVIPRVFPPFTVYSPQKVKYPRFVPKPGEFPGFRCLGYIYIISYVCMVNCPTHKYSVLYEVIHLRALTHNLVHSQSFPLIGSTCWPPKSPGPEALWSRNLRAIKARNSCKIAQVPLISYDRS